MEKLVVTQWLCDLMGEPRYDSPQDPKVMYAFRGMYNSLLESAADTVLCLRKASLSIAGSEQGDEHKRVQDGWGFATLVHHGYWHDLIKDMSVSQGEAGTLESVQRFLEKLQELLRQFLKQMKTNGISMGGDFEDEFIAQLDDVMSDFHNLSTVTDALLTSFHRPATPPPQEDSLLRAFSTSPPTSDENEEKIHVEDIKDSPQSENPRRKPTRRRHRLRPHRSLHPRPSTQQGEERDPKTSSSPEKGNSLPTQTLHLSE